MEANIRGKKIVIYPSIVKYILFSMFSLAFTLGSLLLTFVGLQMDFGFIDTTIKEGYSHSFVALVGVMGLVIFLPLSFYFIKGLIIRKPSVVIDENGIYDNASATSAGYLSWNEIEGVSIYRQEYKVGSQRILGINLKDKDAFLNRFHGPKRFLIKTSNFPVNIPQNSVNMDIEDLYNNIKPYLEKKKR